MPSGPICRKAFGDLATDRTPHARARIRTATGGWVPLTEFEIRLVLASLKAVRTSDLETANALIDLRQKMTRIHDEAKQAARVH